MSTEEAKPEKENEEKAPPDDDVSGGEEGQASGRKAQCYEMFEKVAEYLNGELAGEE